MTVTYEQYNELVKKLNPIYHGLKELNQTCTSLDLTFEELRLIYLACVASKGNLKEFDPKKGLNQ